MHLIRIRIVKPAETGGNLLKKDIKDVIDETNIIQCGAKADIAINTEESAVADAENERCQTPDLVSCYQYKISNISAMEILFSKTGFLKRQT